MIFERYQRIYCHLTSSKLFLVSVSILGLHLCLNMIKQEVYVALMLIHKLITVIANKI